MSKKGKVKASLNMKTLSKEDMKKIKAPDSESKVVFDKMVDDGMLIVHTLD